jgi:hypothetical protein
MPLQIEVPLEEIARYCRENKIRRRMTPRGMRIVGMARMCLQRTTDAASEIYDRR